MEKAFEQLWEFHEVYNCARSNTVKFSDDATREMRINILKEEWEEYLAAEEENDIVEVADALADIIYIAIGTAVSYGIPMDKIFNEVHASNMSKLDEDGNPIYREDGKILKGANYFKPDVKGILEGSKGNVGTRDV